MKECGEECTVVFGFIVTENRRVCGGGLPPPPPLAGSVQYMQRRQCIVLQIPPWVRHILEREFVFHNCAVINESQLLVVKLSAASVHTNGQTLPKCFVFKYCCFMCLFMCNC